MIWQFVMCSNEQNNFLTVTVVSINTFPLHAQFNIKAAEYVKEAINERQSQGLCIVEGMVSGISIIQLTLPLLQVGGLNTIMTYAGWYVQYFPSIYNLLWLCSFGRTSETGVQC